MSTITDRPQKTTLVSILERFKDLYGATPRVFRAPGRVNLIGEHTDYNDGFVMPAAIDFFTWVAVAPPADRVLAVHSEQFGEHIELNPDELGGPPRKHWSDYVRGVAAKLRSHAREGSGANLLISGEVPLGAGLSSSAALEVSTALALSSIWGIELSRFQLAKLCQSAEHEYAGTRCGIMDQFISLFGSAGHCLMLDCRSLDYTALPIPNSARLVICDSKVKHELAGGEYNRRRQDCEAGVQRLRQYGPHITALRDVTPELLEQHKDALPEVVYRRCRHVVTEDERVLRAADALKSGDLKSFGRLMYESHASLRDDYEVSCKELDLLVEIASSIDGVWGARMTGGGFGGCTINLVPVESVGRFQLEVGRQYESRSGIVPSIYVCSAASGAGPVEAEAGVRSI